MPTLIKLELSLEKEELLSTIDLLKKLAGLIDTSVPTSINTQVQEKTEDEEPPLNSVDQNGVAFNDQFCGKATEEPFYTSGKKKGQWKKKRGVDEETYDNWYTSQLNGSDTEIKNEEPVVDTRSAFSPPEPQTTETFVPKTTGDLMKWVSNKIAAGAFSQLDVDEVHNQLGVTLVDFFGDDQGKIGQNVAATYGLLSQKFGA